MSYLLQPLINGKAHEWADVQLYALGQLFTGVSSIEYADEQEMANVMAAGTFPNARTYGQTKPSAKITLLMKEVEALQAASPTGRIQDIPEFDIVVTFVDAAYVTVVHKLRNARFMNNTRKSAAGDGALMVDCDLVISHIEWK